ncbi:tetratricopeptide repeat protein [uncultured Tenacibaculum sp.]|uniref:tetratricopeptide repeat protein n=1 Tax=uncultured Tenacibaculum sp. TaxID=174713 RepID=UPI00263051D4|nr:tetratricopeptide repeat protein [uncultured Tenacibaculum sp.]
MIIQNLHKKNFKIWIESKISKHIFCAFFTFILLLIPSSLLSQDSIPLAASVDEQKSIDFQKHFFKAITHKAINNHQKAIESLDECNQLIPNDVSVLFELSKNYHKLNKYIEAVEYANKALVLKPNNLWISEHLVQVYRRNNALDQAVEIQKNISKQHPKKNQYLVYLYLQKNDIDSAKSVLAELEAAKLLSPRLRRIKKRLTYPSNTKNQLSKNIDNTTKANYESQFKKNKSFSTLKTLLTKLDLENNSKLLVYSKEGITLFPAQPLVYLMNARANNKSKEYKKAIASLQNGIDFVIDNPVMQTNFYNELIKSYQGIGDTKNANKYRKKIKK